MTLLTDEDLDRIEALSRRMEKTLDLPIFMSRCRSGAHVRDGKCGCTGLPRLEALVDLMLRRDPRASRPRREGGET